MEGSHISLTTVSSIIAVVIVIFIISCRPILFCIDYLDPSREERGAETDLNSLRERMTDSLDEVYCEIIGRKIKYTLLKKRKLHPNGIAAWNELCSRQKAAQPLT